jgi:GT2 family glycosyltransferase
MWDDSWKPLEHPEFTVKPFIPNDYDNWWSLKYTMTEDEMNSFNNKVENLDIQVLTKHKFNGCGLVISSEVIKAGVNIPQSVFFVHEDTAFMLMLSKILPGTPQYVIKNILMVHNRNHPSKRMFVEGESGDTINEKRRSNDWYVKANKFSEENCYNLFNPMHKSKTWTDVWR